MEGVLCQHSSMKKPVIPPKPKINSKPNPPPKPPNLLHRPLVLKKPQPPISKKTAQEQEISINERFVSIVSVSSDSTTSSGFSERTSGTTDNSENSDTQSDSCSFRNLINYSCSNQRTEINQSESLQVTTLNIKDETSLSSGDTNGIIDKEVYNSGIFQDTSSSNSTCSDPPNDILDGTDILEKLSDVEYFSDKSTSSSAYLSKCDPTINPFDFNNASYNINSQAHDRLHRIDNNTNPSISNGYNCDISQSKQNKIYNIAKEVMTSEKVFCNVLKLLNVEFRKSMVDQNVLITNASNGNHRYSQNISEDELNRILNYLPQLQNFSEGFLADLEERLADWDHHYKIADIIVTKGPFLKMYSSYIRDFEHQCNLLDEACSKHNAFAKAVQTFEMSEICCKLGIKHYMLKPVQRIPQYRLLLQSYLELLPPHSPDIEDAHKALTILQDVAEHANDTIKIEDKVSQLLTLQRRLFMSDGGQPELIRPGRELLKQGELMKLCRREMRARYFVLLSDALLYNSYNSSSGNSMLRLNTELPLEGMRVSKPIADDFKAELTIRATQRSFTLQAKNESERDEWLKAIEDAIEANIVRRSTFLAASTAIYQPINSYKLGKQAPVWIPDYRVTMCQVCTSEFSITFRRHHCRACGKVVCDSCSSNRAPLEYKKYHSERVCDYCYDTLLSAIEDEIVNKEQQQPSILDEKHNKKSPQKKSSLNELRKLKQTFKKGIRDSMRGKSLRKPDRLLEVSANDIGSQMRGYLRRSGKRGLQNKDWYVLKERVLYQYAAPEDVCALESLPVLGYTLEAQDLEEGSNLSFILKHENQDDITFQAETEELALKWVTAMKEATVL